MTNTPAAGLDEGPFFEHLPVACIYLAPNPDHSIVAANAAAREVVKPATLAPTNSDVPNGLAGLSIFDTDFAAVHLADQSDLKGILARLWSAQAEECYDEKSNDFPRSGFARDMLAGKSPNSGGYNDMPLQSADPLLLRPPPSSNSRFQMAWKLSCCLVHGRQYFCLMAVSLPTWKDVKLSKEDEYDFLQLVVEPASRDAPYYVNVISADLKSMNINKYGRKALSTFANSIEKSTEEENGRENWEDKLLGLWNEDFSSQLRNSDGIGPMALRGKQGIVSCIRGLEQPDGTRYIYDGTATVLHNPWTHEPLGVMVQVREGEEWGHYLERQDVFHRVHSSADGQRTVLVRTLLNNGDLDYFSSSWAHFSGCSISALGQGAWLDCIHPQDVPTLQKSIDMGMAAGKCVECEIRIRAGLGNEYRYFLDRIAPLKDANNSIIRWYCVSTEVHDLVSKRRAAHSAAERLYNIVNNMDVSIFTIDRNYRVRSAEGNLIVDGSSGSIYAPDDFVGQDLEGLSKGLPEFATAIDAIKKVIEGELPEVVVNYQIRDKHFRTIVVPELIEDSSTSSGTSVKGILGLTMDLSVEYENQRATLQLEAMKQTERMKDEFLANVSHELRTPIAGLLGILELLMETNLSHEQIDYLETVQSSARSLLGIVNNILDFSKAEADALLLENIPFDLASVLQDVCRGNEVLAMKKGLEFHRKWPKMSFELLGDAGKFRQILQNLITNAIKFTSTGSVTVCAEVQETDLNVNVTILVEDQGIGIDEATLKILFRPFVQADQSTTRVYGGSGLGLSIARKLANAMGGNVVLESRKDEGTKAFATLQFLKAPIPAKGVRKDEIGDGRTISQSSPLPQESDVLQNIHVLIVEDNMVIRHIALAHLRKLGYRNIASVENGAEAVSYIRTATAQERMDEAVSIPDIVFMDCQMPVVDGYDATRQLRSTLHYYKPIIALTASAIMGDRQKCLDAGMDDHIVKPFSRQELGDAIRKWVRRT